MFTRGGLAGGEKCFFRSNTELQEVSRGHTFISSDRKIATVSSKGKIVAKKKGSVVIKVKTNGIILRCKVQVK